MRRCGLSLVFLMPASCAITFPEYSETTGSTGGGPSANTSTGTGGTGGSTPTSWTVQFGSTGNDVLSAVAMDGSGNVYVGGVLYGELPGQMGLGGGDLFLKKLTSAGAELWTMQFGTNTSDDAFSITADASGNVYIAGYTEGTLPLQNAAGNGDAFVQKRAPDGAEVWTRQFGTSLLDQAYGVTVDASGNVYVAGLTSGVLPGQTMSGSNDAFVRKYSADGDELWTRQFGSPASAMATTVSTDGDGNVYVGGFTEAALPGQTSDGAGDGFVRKYSTSGTAAWTREFGSSGNDLVDHVSADASGNVYVVGRVAAALDGQVSAGSDDAFVRKYAANGTEMWTHQFGTSEPDEAYGVSIDPSGDVFVSGSTTGTLAGQTSLGSRDAFLRRFTSDGSDLWTLQFGSLSDDDGNSVVADGSGNAYVAGRTRGSLPQQTSAGETDAFVMRYVR